MKKNATASKTSLRIIPLEDSATRQPLKVQQKSTLRGTSSAHTPVLKCNNCQIMVERELMKLHLSVCLQGGKGRNYLEMDVCKYCRITVPINRVETHRCEREHQQQHRDVESRQLDRSSEYIDNEMGTHVNTKNKKQDRLKGQFREAQQQLIIKKATRRTPANNPKTQERIQVETFQRPKSRQKELIKRPKNNVIQHNITQKQKQERLRKKKLENERQERLRQQQQREKGQERERQRQQRQRERRIEQERQRGRTNHHHQQPQETQHYRNTIRQEAPSNQQRRNNRRRAAHSSNSRRRPRRQNSMPGINFAPFDIFNQIQSRFNGMNFNGNSFSQHMENLNHQFGALMENFSHMMSPFGNQRRRVIWYEEDIMSNDGEFHYQDEYIEVGSDEQEYYEQQDEGLDIGQIEQIPVHQYNARRQHHTDTTSKSCAVCLSDFIHGETIKALYCSHKFHQDCIDRWLELKGNCPVCRQDLRAA